MPPGCYPHHVTLLVLDSGAPYLQTSQNSYWKSPRSYLVQATGQDRGFPFQDCSITWLSQSHPRAKQSFPPEFRGQERPCLAQVSSVALPGRLLHDVACIIHVLSLSPLAAEEKLPPSRLVWLLRALPLPKHLPLIKDKQETPCRDCDICCTPSGSPPFWALEPHVVGGGDLAEPQLHSEPPRWVLASAGLNRLPGSKQEPPPLPPTQPTQGHLRTRISRGGSTLTCHPTVNLPSKFWGLAGPETQASLPLQHREPQGDPAAPGAWYPCAPFSLAVFSSS